MVQRTKYNVTIFFFCYSYDLQVKYHAFRETEISLFFFWTGEASMKKGTDLQLQWNITDKMMLGYMQQKYYA